MDKILFYGMLIMGLFTGTSMVVEGLLGDKIIHLWQYVGMIVPLTSIVMSIKQTNEKNK